MRSVSLKSEQFTESVIRGMTRLCEQHGGINLAQGFPDFPAPMELKDAAKRAIDDEFNQYAVTWGVREFRAAIAAKMKHYNRVPCDPETEVTVTCGSTEAMIATLLAVVNPGDEIVIFEPFYENYGPDAIMSGATPRYVTLRPPDFTFDPAELRAACGPRTKAIIVNTPHNPSGHVFGRVELETIAAVCREFDCLAITDEIYEYVTYDGREHVSLASLPDMRERTITISGLSKTYSVTGWRLAYAIASPAPTTAIRKMHDFLTVGAPHPLQWAGVSALGLPAGYYRDLAAHYATRRAVLAEALTAAGFRIHVPEGAYYILADIGEIAGVTMMSDVAFCEWLIRDVGVAAVPGSSFYRDGERGRRLIRFAFCKREDTLRAAAERLARVPDLLRLR
ncbi:MAG: aminotransferase class I/II-fold pyridoxal phosphate-dependent enzyme [Deltaproteobacteria bacterium]|nr:aminotransferase class I/II-fold pyridoxal phosphate-dependent enzyme [Deltaproteobacteria bacterium]MBI3390713.1 aminotransferase class I/II-fold pyridoxal phosphate-dependent enzyme [Deltaproteobacteria bacterium]